MLCDEGVNVVAKRDGVCIHVHVGCRLEVHVLVDWVVFGLEGGVCLRRVMTVSYVDYSYNKVQNQLVWNTIHISTMSIRRHT